MSEREQFIREHMAVCTAKRAKKYDAKKNEHALHSIEYSRRKCAKAIWRYRIAQANLRSAGEVPDADVPG